MRLTLTAIALSIAASAAWAAGQVEVRFKPVAELADAGNDRFDGERNLKALADHLVALGRRLPDGQVLKIEVTDLDLAGRMQPMRNGTELRILRDLADWPSMKLKWTLSAGGSVLRSGDEYVSDMAYLQRPLGHHAGEALVYERRLIDRWFDERFGAAH